MHLKCRVMTQISLLTNAYIESYVALEELRESVSRNPLVSLSLPLS